MATVNQTLSCTGTGTPTLRRSPIRTLTSTGTAVPKLLKLPQKVLSSVATHGIIISLIRFGIDSFDVIEGRRKWFVTSGGKWSVSAKQRFTFLVRGKPGA